MYKSSATPVETMFILVQ